MKYFIRLAYNGSGFHGWQIQENAVTVQEELNKALSILLKEEVESTGCGRTDTGVHASCFYAHFETESVIQNEELVYKLNAILPHSIAIYKVFEVEDSMHARFSAISRTYRYFIHKLKNPFLNGTSFFYPHTLDVIAMNQLCEILKTYSDFSCFSKSGNQSATNDCSVYEAFWEEINDGYIFTITANRFLRNMVRAIVGTMIQAGIKKLSAEQFHKILSGKNRSDAGASVAPHGLFLTDVKYDFDKR